MTARKDRATETVRLGFTTARHIHDRLAALAKRDGMTIGALVEEALVVHLFRLEASRDPTLRRRNVCWSCGKVDGPKGKKP